MPPTKHAADQPRCVGNALPVARRLLPPSPPPPPAALPCARLHTLLKRRCALSLAARAQRSPGTRPSISESHSEISTRVPFCIASPSVAQRADGRCTPRHREEDEQLQAALKVSRQEYLSSQSQPSTVRICAVYPGSRRRATFKRTLRAACYASPVAAPASGLAPALCTPTPPPTFRRKQTNKTRGNITAPPRSACSFLPQADSDSEDDSVLFENPLLVPGSPGVC